MQIALALALAAQVPPPPDGPGAWSSIKTDQSLTNAVICQPNGKFSISLRWRFRHGLEKAIIKQNGIPLPQLESRKLISALSRATDLLSVQLGCSGALDAQIKIAYVGRETGRVSAMMLVAIIRSNRLDLAQPVQVPPRP